VLTGRLRTLDGSSDDVRTEVWFDPITSVPRITRKHPQGWLAVQQAISGLVTVTNAEQLPHPDVGSVTFGVYLAYPVDSLVCRNTPSARVDGRRWTPGRCWYDVTLFNGMTVGDRGEGLAPGQQRSGTFGVPTRTAVTLVVPAEDLETLSQELAHPVDVVALTSPRTEAPTLALAPACPGAGESEPTGPAVPGPTGAPDGLVHVQHAEVGTLRPGTCADWPPI
jgi:hypothetical protein